MIPAAFDYLRPTSLEEAQRALVEHGPAAQLLAGGQSLLPLMKLRLATPSVVIDLRDVEGLRGVRTDGATLAIGAMTTYAAAAEDELVRQHLPVLAEVIGWVGDPQTRSLGTVGGAIAHAHPAGDVATLAVALGATVVLAGPSGRREIAVADLVTGYLQTSREAEEILVEVRLPIPPAGTTWSYQKFMDSSRSWATVAAVVLSLPRSGSAGRDLRIAVANVTDVPYRAIEAERVLSASATWPEGFHVLPQDLHVTDDVNARSAYRRHLTDVLVARGLREATSA